MSLEIREIAVERISPAPYNPRVDLTPEDREYGYIENSIHRFGYIEPIVWNEETGRIVGGHQRFKILKAQGAETVQVVVVHFDEEKEKACNLALNRAVGKWDDDKLDLLLCEMKGKGYDMEPFGFEEIEFDWDDVKDLSEDTYEEPDNPRTTCPHCGFTDESRHFRKTSKPDGGGLEA